MKLVLKKVLLIVLAVVTVAMGGALWVSRTKLEPAAQNLTVPSIELPVGLPVQQPSPIRVAVLPHHDILLSEFGGWYQQLADSQVSPITKIFLISPNHFYPYQQQVVTSDEQVLSREHGVQLHLPLIQKYFPQATVAPILVTRNLSASTVEELQQLVTASLDDPGTLVLASIDFSHQLPKAEAMRNDQQTTSLVVARNSQPILELGDGYLDCPVCLHIAVQAAVKHSLLGPEQVFHSDSATYLGQGEQAPTTSYFVWWWRQNTTAVSQ